MAFLGALGKAMKAPVKAVGKLPGMGAVQRGVQKTPGISAVGGKLGLGPAKPPQQVQQAPPLNLQQGPINRMPQPALQNMAQAGAGLAGRFGQMQRPPMPMQPPPQEMQEQAQGPDQEMVQQKIQQMQAMQPRGFGVGPSMGARPHVMPRFGRMMQPQEQPMMDQAQGMGEMPMPNASMDEDRVNRFRQMRQGGIGPRFGGGGPVQY